MNDEGEKTCPLCAEEMDLTDQQLKPCKCGYEICVWCWNHIMEMAEKDETEGRCPACRTPYDRERIVGTAANCERVLAEVHIERKQKSQKAKIKNSESRKQLSSVRVIQRNLVYVVGLPLNLADEDLLQRKEYFGQYGNVLKVSVSRTSAGSIQQFANNTCSVYITYSKEEEAVRCIQSAHGFILDGRPLRACFGTTKYCHAWLRNVPCNNPDCLYLHEIGSQEDSFAKDETISAYTRVQQITGCTSNTQRRSGMALPAPTDDYCNNNSPVTGKAVAKNSSNVPALSVKCSPPSSCSVRSGVLQSAALWESRASNSTPPGSLACSTGPVKQKADVNGLAAISTVVSYNTEASILPNHDGKKCLSEDTRAVQSKNKLEVLQTEQHGVHSDAKGSEVSATLSSAPVLKLGNQSPRPPAAENDNAESCLLVDAAALSGGPSSGVEKGRIPFADEKIQNLCSEMSTMGLDKRTKEHSDIVRRSSLCLDTYRLPAGRGVQWHDSEKLHDVSISAVATTAAGTVDSVNTSTEVCDWKSYVQDHEVHKLPSQTEDDFDNQRLRDAVLVKQATMSASQHLLGHLKNPLQEHAATADVVDYAVNSAASTRKPNEGFETNVPDEFLNNYVSCASVQGFLGSPFNVGQENCIGGFDHGLPNLDSQSAMDLGESSIISNILDLDSWDDSLTSPQNLAKFLGKSDKSEVPVKLANSWKGQICNQSRFSFARQEELRNHLFDFESSLNNIVQGDKDQSFGKSFIENRGRYLDIIGNGFGFSQHTEKSDNLRSSHSALQSSKLALTRSQISAPPGFSVPSRPPPPGFSSHERIDQAFDLKSGNHLLESSSLLRNPYQASPGGNINAASDIELMDPAILAVGEGRLPTGVNNSGMDMRPNIHVQAPLFENDSRLQLLMQRSLSHRQSLRCTKVGDNFCSVSDDYGFTSQQHMGESQRSNLSLFTPFSLHQTRNMVATNGHWNAWSEIQTGNDLRVAELLRNDRLRFNKFGMTSSGDLYNKSFKM